MAISFAQGARGGLRFPPHSLTQAKGLRNVRLRFPQNHGIPGARDFKCDLAAPDCDLVGLWCTTSKSFGLLPIPQEQLGLLPVGYLPPQLYRVLLGLTGLYWLVLGRQGCGCSPQRRMVAVQFPVMGLGPVIWGISTQSPESHEVPAHVPIPQRHTGWPRARCGVGAMGLGLGRRERAVCFVSHRVPLGGFRSILQLDPRYLE